MRIGVVISMFPEHHETFIVRELAELERRGVDFEVFSLQTPRDRVTHPDALRLMERTHYAWLFGFRAMLALFLTVCTQRQMLREAVAELLRHGRSTPWATFKTLVALPLILHMGRLMKKRGITWQHGHWANIPTTACWLIEKMYDIPWSAAIHGENVFTPNALLAHKLNHARFTVACCDYHWRHLRENMGLDRPEDIHLNHHGLEPRVWAAAEASPPPSLNEVVEDPVILAVGRLVPTKGIDVLFEAMHRLAQDGLAPRVVIVGSGPEERSLRRLSAKLGLEERTEFLGQIPFEEVIEQMRAATIFALPCTYDSSGFFDGIPNVLAEAMALGLPVVSTRVSGIPDLIEHGVSGLLVPEHDVSALAEALRQVLTEPSQAARLANAGRTRARILFDLKRNVKELESIFRRYAGAPTAPPSTAEPGAQPS